MSWRPKQFEWAGRRDWGVDVSETMRWSFSVGVDHGPNLKGSDSIDVGAYDKVSSVLESGATDIDVQVQPATAAGKVHILVLQASSYDEDLTFSADGGTTSFSLLGPLVLIGNGAVELLADAPQALRFSNATALAVTVDILVGRDPAP